MYKMRNVYVLVIVSYLLILLIENNHAININTKEKVQQRRNNNVQKNYNNNNDNGGNPLVPSTMDVESRANEITLALDDNNIRSKGRDNSLAKQLLSSVPQMSSYLNADGTPKMPYEVYKKKNKDAKTTSTLSNSFTTEDKKSAELEASTIGYLASQKKIAERFTLAGEIVGITVDGIQIGLINNIIINFARNFRENWSFGITVINMEEINNSLGIDAIVPYIGLQKKF